jgi:acylphosphatase
VCDLARRAGVAGWVRNRLDGSVEVLAQGPPEDVERFMAAIGDGPPLARVTSIVRRAVEVDPELSGFRIRG